MTPAEVAYMAWGRDDDPFFALPATERERWRRVAEAVQAMDDRLAQAISDDLTAAMPDAHDIAAAVREAAKGAE